MSSQARSPAHCLFALGLAAALAAACAGPSTGTDRATDEPQEELRRMAITVDDLPVTPPDTHTTAQQMEITDRLLAVLAQHDAPAIGFVNESKLEVDGAVEPRRVELLERWLEAGHELGNHGHAHLDLHRVDPDAWLADVLRGERVTRPLVEARGRDLRWFRHPFLHTGRSVEVQRRTTRFLEEHGYRVAPVTVDNGEWIYGGAYAEAWNRGDEAAMDRLGRDYVRYMLEVVEFYEAQSREIVGELRACEEISARGEGVIRAPLARRGDTGVARPTSRSRNAARGDSGAPAVGQEICSQALFPQALLIHAYALNADWLDPLLEALEDRGYRWITLDEAVEHPAYERPTHGYTGPGGITWLHRWAITEGRDRELFRGEPEVPGWVRELREGGYTGPASSSTTSR